MLDDSHGWSLALGYSVAHHVGKRHQRSDAKLTVVGLAAEAGIPRARLYEHYADLVSEFKTASFGGPIQPNVQALQQQLADAHERIRQLEGDNEHLHGQITTLCAVITGLTQEAEADNVTPLPSHRRR
ncbi:hypothetical protein [Saccharopolyspora hattusasensis]|uniref:hypothetical protein n=1 Tax=Saccharopolyspora hattusasensis TaxID=1128679 RepID=UPI003D98034D